VDVSIIIPALNEADSIRFAIDAAWAAGAQEVIVVDGGSDDHTFEIAHQCRCHCLKSSAGRAVQQNVGAHSAEGDVLLFLHADNWLAADSVKQLVNALANEKVLCGCFAQKIEAAGFMYRLLEKGNAARVRWQGLPYGDQGIFIRRKTFFDLGLFPEVEIMEDLLLMKQLRRLAWPVLLPGPIHVSPRRWQRNGIIRQTIRNWKLSIASSLGISPKHLAKYYPNHQRSSKPQEGDTNL